MFFHVSLHSHYEYPPEVLGGPHHQFSLSLLCAFRGPSCLRLDQHAAATTRCVNWCPLLETSLFCCYCLWTRSLPRNRGLLLWLRPALLYSLCTPPDPPWITVALKEVFVMLSQRTEMDRPVQYIRICSPVVRLLSQTSSPFRPVVVWDGLSTPRYLIIMSSDKSGPCYSLKSPLPSGYHHIPQKQFTPQKTF